MDVEGVEEDEEMIIEKRDSVREEGQGNKRRKMQDVQIVKVKKDNTKKEYQKKVEIKK